MVEDNLLVISPAPDCRSRKLDLRERIEDGQCPYTNNLHLRVAAIEQEPDGASGAVPGAWALKISSPGSRDRSLI